MGDLAAKALEACVMALRQGREAQANHHFAELMAELPVLLAQSAPARQQQLAAVIPLLFAAQQRRDLLAIADLLQFELAPLMTVAHG